MYELIDEVSLGLCFEVHRSAKIGLLFLDDTDPDSQKDYQIIDEQGVDVFGQVPLRKQYECICPNCQRNLAAARFAPHLEKCMGMGRNSSRIASRRIQANHGRKESDNESEEDNDNEWSYLGDKKAKRLKREKAGITNTPRRAKSQKNKNNGDSQLSVGSTQSDASIPVYDVMSMEERKSLLLQTCGVISEHTKKMCTRSIRCPQHSDDQRKAVRAFLLTTNSGGAEPSDEVHVDIDSYEDQTESNSSQALREALLFQEETNSSPADSNSTTNSSGSKKRKHSKKNNKRKRDRSVTPNVM
ncbi:hypothetical protein CAPTEDRAFT_154471 [Capitella teleta]|uniref:SAGA-associated factor 11 homolog n=1 Tax=Capitella teleta TaxID=283909 RepID=R7V6E3_CAPTE|nr:hypothetical protein CAPTEDRAFT_154471 [Capitella teleta]|eukprot:ELU14037.1 hypothetical protein CAPTEDRAFT_154471 [Capitella teleta]